jgi:hypothetical protein
MTSPNRIARVFPRRTKATPGDADARLRAAWEAGFACYRDDSGAADADWHRFQRAWVRPEIVLSRLKNC